MNDSGISKLKRITTGVIGIMILVVMLFSAYFIASETDHACTGEDCPICAGILQCENTLHQIGSGKAMPAAAFCLLLFMLVSAFVFLPAFPRKSSVANKVRMNN